MDYNKYDYTIVWIFPSKIKATWNGLVSLNKNILFNKIETTKIFENPSEQNFQKGKI